MASTFGEQTSFLDALHAGEERVLGYVPQMPEYVAESIAGFGYEAIEWEPVREHLMQEFGRTLEW